MLALATGVVSWKGFYVVLLWFCVVVDHQKSRGGEGKIPAWGHTAHRGWARLLLNRARDLIIHNPAHHGANGAVMPTDEDDQDGYFFFNHPERGGLLRCLGARSHCYCCLYPIPPLRGGTN